MSSGTFPARDGSVVQCQRVVIDAGNPFFGEHIDGVFLVHAELFKHRIGQLRRVVDADREILPEGRVRNGAAPVRRERSRSESRSRKAGGCGGGADFMPLNTARDEGGREAPSWWRALGRSEFQ
jgi:hypothetical protein